MFSRDLGSVEVNRLQLQQGVSNEWAGIRIEADTTQVEFLQGDCFGGLNGFKQTLELRVEEEAAADRQVDADQLGQAVGDELGVDLCLPLVAEAGGHVVLQTQLLQPARPRGHDREDLLDLQPGHAALQRQEPQLLHQPPDQSEVSTA